MGRSPAKRAFLASLGADPVALDLLDAQAASRVLGGIDAVDAFLRDSIGVVRRGFAPLPGPAHAYWSSVSHEDAAAAVVAALDVPAGV